MSSAAAATTANYHAIPLPPPPPPPRVTPSAPRVRRALPLLPLALLVLVSVRQLPSAVSSSRRSDAARAHRPPAPLWRSMPVTPLCQQLRHSRHCAARPHAALCSLCHEMLGGSRVTCATIAASRLCELPPHLFYAPPCARCAPSHAQLLAEPQPSEQPLDEEEQQQQQQQQQQHALLASVEPEPHHTLRWSFLSMCQRLKDTEAFCLEETLDQQLCEPCSYCEYLRRTKSCHTPSPPVECLECGLVSQ